MEKIVVLFSGGLDSTVLLTMAVDQVGAHNVTALNMFYGQKHAKELEHAKLVAEELGVKLISRDLSAVFQFEKNNPLLGDGEMPEGEYAKQLNENGVVSTYIPFRNGLFLSYATAIAYSLGADTVMYGAHSDDAAGNAYPDCSRDFYDAMEASINTGTGGKVDLYAPFIQMHKGDIVREGLEHKAPMELSWSCYEGGELHCGKCATCIDRWEAFRRNGKIDPVAYAIDMTGGI